jgi:hypothetical protein
VVSLDIDENLARNNPVPLPGWFSECKNAGAVHSNKDRRVTNPASLLFVLNQFIDGIRDSGFLRDSIGRANLPGVEVAPR